MRSLIFQLHFCDINEPITKIICLRKIYLSLTKKIVYGKKNLFLLPSRQAGKNFIDKISTDGEWIYESPLKDIALKAIKLVSSLLLQKLLRKWKSKDHLKPLENRMKLWQAGEIMELLKEAEIIQRDLRVSKRPSTIISEISKKFTHEMRKGNINNAMKLLADNMQNGILPLTHSFPMHPFSTPVLL